MKKTVPPLIGIYQIENMKNGQKYVGVSTRIYKRLKDHMSFLANGTHINKQLLESWNKDGPENFSFSILEIGNEPLLLPGKEIYWIHKTSAQNLGYNTQTDLFKERALLHIGSELKKELEALNIGSMNETLKQLIEFYDQHKE